MQLFFGKFRNVVVVLCFLFAGMMPASAQLHVDDILVSKAGSEFNIRLNLSNLGNQGVKGPTRAELFIQERHQKEWRLLKTWTNIPGLPPGHKASRDFFISENENSALSGGFSIKAVIQPPYDEQVQGLRNFGPGMWE